MRASSKHLKTVPEKALPLPSISIFGFEQSVVFICLSRRYALPGDESDQISGHIVIDSTYCFTHGRSFLHKQFIQSPQLPLVVAPIEDDTKRQSRYCQQKYEHRQENRDHQGTPWTPGASSASFVRSLGV